MTEFAWVHLLPLKLVPTIQKIEPWQSSLEPTQSSLDSTNTHHGQMDLNKKLSTGRNILQTS